MSMEHRGFRREEERCVGMVVCVVYSRPSGRLWRLFIIVYTVSNVLGTCLAQSRNDEIILSRSHPKLCDRLRMGMY